MKLYTRVLQLRNQKDKELLLAKVESAQHAPPPRDVLQQHALPHRDHYEHPHVEEARFVEIGLTLIILIIITINLT